MINLLQVASQPKELHNSCNSFLGALLGALIPVIIFLLTIYYDRNKEKKKKQETINQRLRYFSSMIENISHTVRNQSKYLKVFFETQRQNTLDIPLLTQLTDKDLKRFSEFQNHEEYYHAFLNKFGDSSEILKEYRDFYLLVDFLKAMNDQLQERLMKSIQYDNERKKRYLKIVEKTMDKAALIVCSATHDGSKTSNFERFLNQILTDYYSKEIDYDGLSYLQSDFVIPVKDEIFKSFPNLNTAILLAIELKRATFIFNDIKIANNKIADDFEKEYLKYNNASIELETLANKFRNRLEIKT